MKTCRRGHKHDKRRCPECQRMYDLEYRRSPKGQRRDQRYEKTAAGLRRRINYDKLRGRDTRVLEDALAERAEYEASGSELSFVDWLEQTYPLPPFRPL
jgi:hypothetical protein